MLSNKIGRKTSSKNDPRIEDRIIQIHTDIQRYNFNEGRWNILIDHDKFST